MAIKKIFTLLILIIIATSAFAVEKKTNFTNEIFKKAKVDGKTIVINSYEKWCGTCSKQNKILNEAENKFKDIVFLSYEQSKNKYIAEQLNIKFWTTILVFKGNEEKAIVITNKVNTALGYSGNTYDVSESGGLIDGILYPALDPSIFEVKYPNTDIQGRVLGDNLQIV